MSRFQLKCNHKLFVSRNLIAFLLLYITGSIGFEMKLQAAVSMLKQDYKENETNLKEAIELAVKVFGKTLDTNKLTSEKGNAILLHHVLENLRIGVLLILFHKVMY